SPLHPHAASHSLTLALELLEAAAIEEAESWPGDGRFPGEVQALAARVRDVKTSTDDEDCELVRVERLAVETVRLAHQLAGARRPGCRGVGGDRGRARGRRRTDRRRGDQRGGALDSRRAAVAPGAPADRDRVSAATGRQGGTPRFRARRQPWLRNALTALRW